MARHTFTLVERMIACERALASPKTPKQLKPSLEKTLAQLREQVATTARGSR